MEKKDPEEPKTTRINIIESDTVKMIVDTKFKQETTDMRFKHNWIR